MNIGKNEGKQSIIAMLLTSGNKEFHRQMILKTLSPREGFKSGWFQQISEIHTCTHTFTHAHYF